MHRHAGCPPGYDEETYARLVAWRGEVARERSVPAFVIFTDATLMAIAEERPPDPAALLRIPGVGRVKAEQFGEAVLATLAGEGAADLG